MTASLETLKERACSPRACEVIFHVSCAAWIVYRVLRMSYLGDVVFDDKVFNAESVYTWIAAAFIFCECVWARREEHSGFDVLAVWVVVAMWWGGHQLGAYYITAVVLIVYASRHYDVRKSIACATAVLGITCLAIMLCAACGIIEDTIIYQYGRVRHCLGFAYALFPSQLVFALTCAVCGLRGKRLTVVEALVLLGTNALMYVLTDSRLSSGIAIVLIVATLSLRIDAFVTNSKLTWVWRALTWSFVAVFVLSVVLVLLYGAFQESQPDVMGRINSLCGSRLEHSNEALELYPVSAFGRHIRFVGNGLNAYGNAERTTQYFYVDMLFIRSLVERGWVYTVGLVLLYTHTCRKLLHRRQYGLVLAMAATAAHCLMDDLAMDLSCNLLILALGLALTTDGVCVESLLPRTRRLGWSSVGAAICGLTVLFFCGIVGSSPADIDLLKAFRGVENTEGNRFITLAMDDDGQTTITDRGREARGKMRITNSNKRVASFELWDENGEYVMTLVVPRNLSTETYAGVWKVYFAQGGKENQYSDYWNLMEDGTARVLSGQFNVLARSDDALQDSGDAISWSASDCIVKLGVDLAQRETG